MAHTNILCRGWEALEDIIQKSPSPIELTGRTLTIPQIIAVARYDARTELEKTAIDALEASRQLLEARIQKGDVIYGVNTGFGGSADVRTKKPVVLQRAIIRELHYGILPAGERDSHIGQPPETVAVFGHDLSLDTGGEFARYIPMSWARAAILIRMNSLLLGVSSVRPVILERMQDLLHHQIIPMIPLRGSISASGDLSPLSYISGAIQGKPTIQVLSRTGQHTYADQAFAKAGLDPVELLAKEGLAMINGTAMSAAAATLALHDTHGFAVLAQALTAMAVEALSGTDESFHPFIAEVRPHAGQIESARNILAFLKDSQLIKHNDGADSSLCQDRYSIRTSPQWLGPILEDLVLAHQQLQIECNSATDNPIATPDGVFLHGGNFQAKSVTAAMEKTRQGIQGIGRMIFSQCTELINPATNRGLPPNLVIDDPRASYIFKGTDINVAALAAELGFLASPVNHVMTAEMGNQSINSLALISARYTHTANEVLSQMLAGHLLAVCQAIDLRAMHVQFLESYHGQLSDLMARYHFEEDGSDALHGKIWSQIMESFNNTASMGPEDRFIAIAKSVRSVILDVPGLLEADSAFTRLSRFVEELASSLHEAWSTNKEAYIAHGDATAFLGQGSRVVYRFVRQELKIPIIATPLIATPFNEGNGIQTAPTVGTFTAAIGRVIQNGLLVKVVVDYLKEYVQ
ncbi:phenylalanine ammonia-lyase [Stachybotrys elegans]|uniref:Phenylalanine ammonia-lyase n=1 Tax=Stachybotrys elegans TaxID=80388 RepID=A0A8K0SEE5_9HYPO|nr:phenylalanine ammonia-lyase [Stachybotrys elegans]